MNLQLRCPQCGVILPTMKGTGILTCACSRYPQIDDVPTIKTSASASEEIETAGQAIEVGGRVGAMEWIRKWCDSNQCSLDALTRVVIDVPLQYKGTFIEDWQRYGMVGMEDYFILRWACPSFLCNLALLPIFAGKRMLDLGCGVGHLAHQASLLSPPAEVVAADGILLHNLVLRKYFAPETPCICLDMEDHLPFPEQSFDLVILNDCFHYVTGKKKLLKEIFRILNNEGLVALVHVHDPRNLSGERVPGEPLEPNECVKLIREAEANAVISLSSERVFLKKYFQGNEIGLMDIVSDQPHLEPGPYLVFASKTDDLFLKDQRSLAVLQPYKLEQLILNSVYQVSSSNDGFTFSLQWPNMIVFEEFGRELYLPQEVRVRQDIGSEQLAHLRRMGILIPDPRGTLGQSLTGNR